jgi:hypothetical protein
MTVAVSASGIGTLRERSLHAALRVWYERPGDDWESRVDGFLIDIVRCGLLIEIQTRNLGALKRKLARLTACHPVRLVYPIAREKWIVRLDADGHTVLTRRRSPKHGRLEHIFVELVRLSSLLANPNFSLEIVFIQEEEILCNDGGGGWRRRGWSLRDRRLLQVLDAVVLAAPEDYRRLLPTDLPQPFSSQDLADTLGEPRRLAQAMIRCLRALGLLISSGKRSHSLLYKVLPGS